MIRRAKFLACLVVGVVFAGCASTKPPAIAVIGASMAESTNEAAKVQIALRLQNPNNDPLELLEFDYSVEVNGREVYQGTRSAQMTLARLSTREIEIPAVIPYERTGWRTDAMPPAAQVNVHGTLRYLAPGTFAQTLFDIGVRRPRTGFGGVQSVALTVPTSGPVFSDAR